MLIIRADVLPKVFNELLAINVIIVTRVKETEQTVSLPTLDSVCTEEVLDLTSRDPAVVIWAQVTEGFAHRTELLRSQLCNLLADLKEFSFLSTWRAKCTIASGPSAWM